MAGLPAFFALLLVLISSSLVSSHSCLGEGGVEKLIPSTHINDDYCDCVDGTDEPGTSACAQTDIAFICEGDMEKKMVNYTFFHDRICDCCDGTDEPPGLCKNTCEEERERKEEEVLGEIEKITEGEVKKKGYMKQGSQGVKQLDGAIKKLRGELEEEQKEVDKRFSFGYGDNTQVYFMYQAFKRKQERLTALESLAREPIAFGKRKEFYPLLGQCLSAPFNEKHFKGGTFEPAPLDFSFTICPFSSITQEQIEKKGGKWEKKGQPTLLGVWSGWDPEMPYNTMIYTNGDDCWNGPNRVVRVEVVCDVEDRLIDVAETSKCTYSFVLGTPAACDKKKIEKLRNYLKVISPEKTHLHDEL